VLLLAVVARAVWAIAVPVRPTSDCHAYDFFARSLAAGGTFGWAEGEPTAYWSVGPAFVYSLFYRVFGISYAPIVVFQVILSVASVALAMALCERWFGRRASLLCGLFLALWPSQVQFVTVLAAEALFSFALLWICRVWYAQEAPSAARVASCGLLVGLANHLRPTNLFLPLVFATADLVGGAGVRKASRTLLVMLPIVVLVSTPWSLRNAEAFGQFCGLTCNAGINLWQGNNPESEGWYQPAPQRPEFAGRNSAEISSALGREAMAYIRAEPIAFVLRSVAKLFRQHAKETIGVVWNAEGLAERFPAGTYDALRFQSAAYWLLMIALASAGLILLLRERGLRHFVVSPPVTIWGYFAAVHAVVVIQDRYSFQSVPFIAMIAAFAAERLWRRLLGARAQASGGDDGIGRVGGVEGAQRGEE
jgi:4-amino-4-deoxy-L-arabinose transferase-like glycosyltransferase